jgi:hypothetical protein
VFVCEGTSPSKPNKYNKKRHFSSDNSPSANYHQISKRIRFPKAQTKFRTILSDLDSEQAHDEDEVHKLQMNIDINSEESWIDK